MSDTIDVVAPPATPYTVSAVTPAWVTTSTPTGVTGDDASASLTLPFTFTFFGTSYTTVQVGSNGILQLGACDGCASYAPQTLPNATAPNTLIAALWRDLNPSAGGTITYLSSPTQFVVTWSNVPNYGTVTGQTFQAILLPDGRIRLQYQTITTVDPTTVGIENPTGATAFPAPSAPTSNSAWEWTPGGSPPPPPVPTVSLNASPTGIATGQSSTLTWSSTNATSCTASGGWSGAKALSGSQSVSPTTTTTYTLTCTGAGGSGTASATVGVSANGFTLTASPTTLAPGGTITVRWTAPNGRPPDDWIGLFIVGASDDNYTDWRSTNGAASGTLTFPAPSTASLYECRYLFLSNEVVATSNTVLVTTPGTPPTIGAPSVSPGLIDPLVPQLTTLSYTLDQTADVTIKLFNEQTRQLVRTLTATARPIGRNSAQWNGATDAGPAAALGVYYFTIDAVNAAAQHGTYNDAASPLPGPLTTARNGSLDTTTLDPFRNELVRITYEMEAPGRITVNVLDGNSAVIVTLLNRAPRPAGPQLELWDGRRTDGTIYSGTFHAESNVPEALPENAVILDHRSDITSLRAEAYLIQPAYGEVSLITYTLARNAAVTIRLTDPNGNVVRTLRNNVAQTAGPQQVEWNGRSDDGRMAAVEGDYRITLTIVDSATGLSSTRIGSIMVYR